MTQLLVIAGFAGLLASGSQPVYLASGRPEIQTYLMGLSALFLLPALLFGVTIHGAIGAAVALVVVQTILAVLDIVIVIWLLKVRVGDLAKSCWRSLASLAVMAVTVQAIIRSWPEDAGYAGEAMLLLVAVIGGGASYLGCSLSLWRILGADPGPERHIWRAINGLIGRFRAKLA